jgi:hypothetical protein
LEPLGVRPVLEPLGGECGGGHVPPAVPAGGTDAKIEAAVTNSFGFGGFNTSLVLGRWSEART